MRNRTASPGLFVFVPYLIIIWSLNIVYLDFHSQNWGNLAFASQRIPPLRDRHGFP